MPVDVSSPDNPNNFGENAYVRWRPRMVRQSVYQDMVNTVLVLAGWPVVINGVRQDGGANPTPLSDLKVTPINIIEYFPEEGFSQSNPVLPNTLALDNGLPGPLDMSSMGGLFERPYRFQFAFYGENDAVAQSLFSDLADRYLGLAESPYITLYNYRTTPDPTPIVRMEVRDFQYTRAPGELAPWEKHLFLAALELTDYVNVSDTRTFE